MTFKTAIERGCDALAAVDVSAQQRQVTEMDRQIADLLALNARVRAEIKDITEREAETPDPACALAAVVAAYSNGDSVTAAMNDQPAIDARKKELHTVLQGLKAQIVHLEEARRTLTREHLPRLAEAVEPVVSDFRSQLEQLARKVGQIYANVTYCEGATSSSSACNLVDDLRPVLGALVQAGLVKREPLQVDAKFVATFAPASNAIAFAGRTVPATVVLPDPPLTYLDGVRSVVGAGCSRAIPAA